MAKSKLVDVTVPRIALSRADLCIALGVCGNSIDQMVAEGFLPPARQWHKRKMWIVHEVQAALLEWPTAAVPVSRKDEEEDWSMSNEDWTPVA